MYARTTTARPDQTTRQLRTPRRSMLEQAVLHALFVDQAPAAPAAAAPAAAAASAPAAAPAGAAPAAAGDGKPPVAAAAPAADGKPPVAAAADAPAAKPDGSIIAAVEAPKAAEPTAAEQRTYLEATPEGKKAIEGKTDAEVAELYKTAKTAADAKAAAGEIKITVPEGITIDDATLATFQETLADAKLTPTERAQRLVDMHASALKAAAEGPYKLWATTQAEWQGVVKADPELGGKNYDTVRATISKALTEVGGKEAAEIFQAFAFTGAGNNPAIVRGVYRMAKMLVEGGPVTGAALSQGKGADFATRVAAMYPSSSGSAAAPKA